MQLSESLVGTVVGPPSEVSWSNHDTLLYALAVGAGQADPASELQYTSDTSAVPFRALPSFAATVAGNVSVPALLEVLHDVVDPTTMLHGDQSHEAVREFPTVGTAISSSRITSVWDKGSAAVVGVSTTLTDTSDGSILSVSHQSMFFRGAGGWGGARGPSASGGHGLPDRSPDLELLASTRRDQPLLYRLTGDSNPLHTDPEAARRAGFERPIMHGMCVFGIATRVLTDALLDGDPARFSSVSGRFTHVAMPGDSLAIAVWREAEGRARFQVSNPAGKPVLSGGTFDYHPDASFASNQESRI